MYSLMPALVSALFLGYGVYVVAVKGLTRVTAAFLFVSLTTFAWQGTWAVLFQVRDPQIALILVKFGYVLIIFLPTVAYHFIAELTKWPGERRYVLASYCFAAALAAIHLGSNLFVAGYFDYFFGYYPKAGPTHPLHLLQTVTVIGRSLYITAKRVRTVSPSEGVRLRLCFASVLVYSVGAVDYLCNYGWEFYPPGVAFITVGLGIIVLAVTRHDLMSPATVAASVAHELRTPLATIRMQARALAEHLPELHQGYRLAVEHGLYQPSLPPDSAERLAMVSHRIRDQVDRSNVFIDMMLASARSDRIETGGFDRCSIRSCVERALATYPFVRGERERVVAVFDREYDFHGSAQLFEFVLFNLLKNALYSLKAADKGEIVIRASVEPNGGTLTFTDTGLGMSPQVRERLFEPFFTTKSGTGTGIGLLFCRRVVAAFGGTIRCVSEEGSYTTFQIDLPPLRGAAAGALPNAPATHPPTFS